MVSGDAISHLVNPIDPVLLPWHLFGALPCLNTQPHRVNVTRVQGIYRVSGRSVCDERYSQPVNGWLKKVGVPDFVLIPDFLIYLSITNYMFIAF